MLKLNYPRSEEEVNDTLTVTSSKVRQTNIASVIDNLHDATTDDGFSTGDSMPSSKIA